MLGISNIRLLQLSIFGWCKYKQDKKYDNEYIVKVNQRTIKCWGRTSVFLFIGLYTINKTKTKKTFCNDYAKLLFLVLAHKRSQKTFPKTLFLWTEYTMNGTVNCFWRLDFLYKSSFSSFLIITYTGHELFPKKTSVEIPVTVI